MIHLSHALLNPKRARRNLLEVFLVAIFYATLSLLISLWIFADFSSIAMIFLTVISSLYVTQGILIFEEKREDPYTSEKILLKRHARSISFFIVLFLGYLVAFTFWTIALPQAVVNNAFDIQAQEFRAIQNLVQVSGHAFADSSFGLILLNNLRVLFLSLLFALFYGAGALFVLAWNASILGFVIGSLVKDSLGLVALPYAFLKFFVHGIPEMIAYFIAALAGGIAFIAILKGDLSKEKMKKTFSDILVLLVISVIILIVAAALEVYVSPLL